MWCNKTDEILCDSRRNFLIDGTKFIALAALGFAAEGVVPVLTIRAEAADSIRRYPVPPGDSVSIDRQSQVILVRYQNNIYAFALSCPHENAAVKWVQKDGRFQCTKHDSRYQPNGVHTAGRATRNMDRYAIRREDPSVVVDLNRWFQSDKDPSGWASATVSV